MQRTILLGVLAVCLTALAIAFMVTRGQDGGSGSGSGDTPCFQPARLQHLCD